MTVWKFTDMAGDLDSLVLRSFTSEMFLPTVETNIIELFDNGDRMTIDLANRLMYFDGVQSTKMYSSRLNMKRHQWYGRGLIVPAEV